MPPDGLGVRLEQAEELILGRHGLAPEYPPRRLGEGLVDQRQDVLEAVGHPLPRLRRTVPQRGGHARRLPAAGPGDADESGIRLLEVLGGLLPLAPSDAVQLLGQTPDAAGARAE